MKLQKVFFFVLGLAFLASLGSLISGGSSQKAQVIGITGQGDIEINSPMVILPANGTFVAPGSTIDASCTYSPAPRQLTLIGAPMNPYQQIIIFDTDQGNTRTSISGSVTVPENAIGEFHIQCVAQLNDGTVSQSNVLTISSEPPPADDTQNPTRPVNLRAATPSSSSINISWSPSEDNVELAGYNIYRNHNGTTGVNTTTPYATVSHPTTTFTDNGLVRKTYAYRVRAVDTSGNLSAWATTVPNASGATSAVVKAAPPLPAPATGVTVGDETTNSLTVNWSASASSNVFDYVIYANAGGTTSVNTTVPVGTVLATAPRTFVHQDLNPNVEYSYRVAARDDAGNRSALSGVVKKKTLVAVTPPPAVPPAPSIVLGGAPHSSVVLSWTNVSGLGYKVFRSTTSNGTYIQVPSSDAALITSGNFTNTGLNPDTTYHYKIQACYTSTPENCSAQSSSVNIRTSQAPDTSAPTVPANIQVTGSTLNSISISWSPSTDIGGGSVAGYNVFRSDTPGGSYTQIGGNITGTTYTDSDLPSGVSRSYKVRAFDNAPNPNYSAQSSTPATGSTLSLPAVPTGVTVGSPTASSLTVSWNAVTGASSYRIFRNNGGSTAINTTTPVGTVVSPNINFVDNNNGSGLQSGTSYSYRVAAVNSIGQSSLSPSTASGISGTTASPQITLHSVEITRPDGTPLQTLSSSGVNTINIGTQGSGFGTDISIRAKTNSADTDTGSVSFNVNGNDVVPLENNVPYMMFGDNNAWPNLTAGPSTVIVTPYSDNAGSGQAGVPQTFTINFVNNDDTTPPNNPTSVSVRYRSSSQIKIGWTNPTDPDSLADVSSYKVYRDGDLIGFVNHPTNTYSDETVNATSSYSYKVTSVDTSGNEKAMPDYETPNIALSTQFSVNAEVETTASAPLRSSPEAAASGAKPQGSIGTITNGPVWVATTGGQGNTYWYVEFSAAPHGWVNELQLENYVAPPETLTITPAGPDITAGTINASCTYNGAGGFPDKMVINGAFMSPYSPAGGYATDDQGPNQFPWGTYNSNTFSGSFTIPSGYTGRFDIQCITYANDQTFNKSNEYNVTSGPPAPDNTAPTITNFSPSTGTVLTAGTQQVDMTVTTNENATCKWSTSASATYSSMTETFTGAGSTSHNYPLLGLTNGQSYTRYVRCQDTAGNAMASSTAVSFSVSNTTAISGCTNPSATNYNPQATVDDGSCVLPPPPPGNAPIVTTPQRSLTPQQIAVVCNSQYSQSCQVADHYLSQRGIPTSNKVVISIPTGDVISSSQFNNYNGTGLNLRDYVLGQIPGADIQGAILMWKSPYAVSPNASSSGGVCTPANASCVSITNAFAKGGFMSDDTIAGPSLPTTAYFNSSSVKPKTDHNYLPTFILPFDSGNYAQGAGFINQSIAGDNTYPNAEIYMLSTADNARSGPRHSQMTPIEGLFNQTDLGTTHYISSGFIANDPNYNQMGGCTHWGFQNQDYITNKTNVLGYFTGRLCPPAVETNTYLPGSIADHLTSHGGDLTGESGQMPISEWLKNGVSASMGTIKEPWTSESYAQIAEEFSNVNTLIKEYYSGASALEAYFKSVKKPGNTLFVGEPLANPWKDPQITFNNNTLVIGLTHIKPGETWKLQSSINGTNWSDVSGHASITAPNGKFGLRTITVTNATAPYYRLLNTNNTSLPQIQRPISGQSGPTADTSVPTIPSALTISNASSSSISFNWTASQDNVGVTGYRIFRSSSQAGNFAEIGTSTTSSYTNSGGLSPSTIYWYKVSAYDAAGNESEQSTAQSFATTSNQQASAIMGLNGPVGPNTTVNATPGPNPNGRPDYFISCDGNDSNNGTSINTPWRNLSKLDSVKYNLQPGTRIMLKRGCEYQGYFHIVSSGTASQPIEYTAYGTGSAPIVSGTNLVTNWTIDSGNIYKATIGSGLTPKYLFVGSDVQPQAQTPNPGSWFFTDSRTTTSITDSQLGSLPSGSLVGAEMMLRSEPWAWTSRSVAGHNGSTISFDYAHILSGWEDTGWAFALKNKKSFIDTPGEWYYDSVSGVLYFQAPGNVNPNTLQVKISSQDFGFDFGTNQSYVNINNIILEGYEQRGIRLESNKGVKIENVEIRKSSRGVMGGTGFDNPVSDGLVIRNSHIHNIFGPDGVWILGSNGNLLEGNVIEKVFLNPMTDIGPSWEWANGFGVRVVDINSNFIIRNNIVRETGYIGIVVSGKSFNGNNSIVEKNLVSKADMMANDGGGISFDYVNGLTVQDNIVKETSYETDLMPVLYPGYRPIAFDYYYGNMSIRNLLLRRNVSISSPSAGIWRDSDLYNTGLQFIDNILYNAGDYGIGIALTSVEQDFNFQCAPSGNSQCYVPSFNDIWTGNRVYQNSSSEPTVHQLQTWSNGNNTPTKYGSWSNNYFFNPFRADGRTMQEYRHYNSSALAVGDPIEITASGGLSVRSTSACTSSTVLGTQSIGSVGIIQEISGDNCIRVNFSTGQSGWVYRWGGIKYANRNISEWQTSFTTGGSGNTKQDYSLSSVSQMPPLYVNETNSPKTVNIGAGKCDHAGQPLPSSYVLQSFASAIVPEDCSLQ